MRRLDLFENHGSLCDSGTRRHSCDPPAHERRTTPHHRAARTEGAGGVRQGGGGQVKLFAVGTRLIILSPTDKSRVSVGIKQVVYPSVSWIKPTLISGKRSVFRGIGGS